MPTTLIQMSLSGALIILTVLVIRALAIHRLPKRLFPALWGVALIRLLIPFELPSRLSLFSLLRRAPAALDVPAPAAVPALSAPISTAAPAVAALPTETVTAAIPSAAPAPALPAIDPWLAGWLIGLTLCALFFGVSYALCRRRFRESLPVECGFVQRWLMAHPLRRPIQARQTDYISAPLTYGVLRPVILLPSRTDWSDEPALNYVLTHEWIHIRRCDAAAKLLLIAAACIHWFNPLAWVMFALANRDLELACDEQVVRAFGLNSRRAYALTLIQMEEHRRGLSPLYSHFSRTAIEERITAIMKTGKTSLIATALALLLMLSAVTAFATSAPKNASAPNDGIVTESASQPGEAALTREIYQKSYAEYEPYGLSYREADGRLYFEGQKVRYFEDMYPVDLTSRAGKVFDWDDGEIDVYAVRELNDPILRSDDGSYDPSGTLTGLRAATPEEFEAHTQKRNRSQTGTPEPETNSAFQSASESGQTRLSRAEYDSIYAKYAPYGLSYGEDDGRLYYQGQKVRYFEDMYPNEAHTTTGTLCQFPDGEVDVRAVRDVSQPIWRNADGTFDPSGTLVGLEACSEEEFAQRTPIRLWSSDEDGDMQQDTAWGSHPSVAFDEDSAEDAAVEEGAAGEDPAELLNAFRVDGYAEMSVADFNRLLMPADADPDRATRLLSAYADLTASDSHLDDFFTVTLNLSLTELYAQYCDDQPGWFCYLTYSTPKGTNSQYIGTLNAMLWRHYEILDADALTVGQRDALLTEFGTQMQRWVNDLSVDEAISAGIQAKLSAEADRVAAELSTDAIRLSGEIDNVEIWSDRNLDAMSSPEALEGTAESAADQPDSNYWTAEEYSAMMAGMREELASLVSTGAQGYDEDDGLFLWTSEKVEAYMAPYEQTLNAIQNGVMLPSGQDKLPID
ncbi:MAG: M56 family metallopeptidase [Clostridia bacterium]|nr:M56 family metallopeptidase [Clostridia bacterium]